ncbi:flagellar hook-associated protein FlgL [Ferrimonas lipolytica]|uniref:Flagellar hook-associated protein FlgL n=1 Tax=Ferrimonas lipolytica TaxID=2724191 RepID=A0A6H1UFZ4_9GAMM|nr:flagellar hook-associated protein FlgL [Ferrimonas lipolytica]QIZ77243.1 flagellar hook-associated protein FlgL [Ferrimonas lipolytica]
MRLATSQFYNSNTSSMTRLQIESNETLQQLATGKRINTTADDPVASIALENLNQQDERLSQYQNNITLANNRLSQQESRVGEYEDLLMSLRDKILQSNDGALDDSAREALALDLEEGLNSIIALGNTQDENGNYVFAGYQSDVKPFVTDANGDVTYLGDEGRRSSQVAEGISVQVSESGQTLFMDANTGSGDYSADYANATMNGDFFVESADIIDPSLPAIDGIELTFGDDGSGVRTVTATDDQGNVLLPTQPFDASQPMVIAGREIAISGSPEDGDSVTLSHQPTTDVFSSVQSAIDLLRSPNGLEGNNAQAEFAQILTDFDGAQEAASVVRAESGNYLSSLDTFQAQHESMELVNATAKSSLEDLDYAAAITKFEQQSLALNAVTQSFAQIQSVSLFNYI